MSVLRDTYRALDLKTLDTVDFSESQWRLLEGMREGRFDRGTRNSLPLIVAQFKRAAAEEVMEWASAQKTTHPRLHQYNELVADGSMLPVVRDYAKDIYKVDAVLSGSYNRFMEFATEIGAFEFARTSMLHGDTNKCPYGYNSPRSREYISRLGNLPVRYVRKSEVNALPLVDRIQAHTLMTIAGYVPTQIHLLKFIPRKLWSARALQKLTERGLLKTLPLGAVAVMSINYRMRFGTPHCSSNLPLEDGKHKPVPSAFLRTKVFGSSFYL